MQEFLLNDKVIEQINMQHVDLKDKTKFIKKYDISTSNRFTPHKQFFQGLYQNQKHTFACNQQNESTLSVIDRKKNLLSNLTLSIIDFNKSSPKNHSKDLNSTERIHIKQGYFTVKGIKRSIKQLTERKGSNALRTCSLVTQTLAEDQFRQYDANYDLRFRNSPRCFISPKNIRKLNKQNEFSQELNKQNIHVKFLQVKRKARQSDDIKKQPELTIKQRVDKQMQQQLKKRRIMCRTAPFKSYNKQITATPTALQSEELSRAESKIYNEMRQNRQKSQIKQELTSARNHTLQRNRPYSNTQINKSTVRLLKKYKCESMTYFNKFVLVKQ